MKQDNAAQEEEVRREKGVYMEREGGVQEEIRNRRRMREKER